MRLNVLLSGMAMLVSGYLVFPANAVAQGETFNFTSTPSASIPDGEYNGSLASMVCDIIDASSIPAESIIADVELEVAIDHTWIGDLVIKLQTPDGSILGVLSRPGMEEFGDDGGGCCGIGTTISSAFPVSFFDTALNDAEEMGAGLANGEVVCADDGLCDYFPNPDSIAEPPSGFADLAGGDASGDWVLCVGDAAFEDFGVFESWTLDITIEGELEGPVVSISPSSIDFGELAVGATSELVTVTIDNPGTEPVGLDPLSISGTDEADFALTNDTCSGVELAPTESCTFDVEMTPSQAGARSAQVDVSSNAPTSPDLVALEGLGIAPDDGISITPASINFGDVEVGTTAAAVTVTIENTGTENLDLGSLTINGANAADFALTSDTCSDITLEPAETCTFDVDMTPAAPGLRAAQVDVPSNLPTSPNTVSLEGTGIDEDDIIFQDRFEAVDQNRSGNWQ